MKTALIDGDILLHSAMWKTSNLEGFVANCHDSLELWLEGAFCKDYILTLGRFDGWNYREELYPAYKKTSTREKARANKPAHFNEAKEYLYSLPYTCIAEREEADDLIGQLSFQLEEPVIVTMDKDLNQIPGVHYTPHYLKPRLFNVTEEEAVASFLTQMLMGDAVDNIPGIPKMGPKKVDALGALTSDLVLETYKDRLGDEWYDWFILNGKLLFIQRKADESFNLDKFYEYFRGEAQLELNLGDLEH